MKTTVPWLRVFVEGVVIVGSILLAFGIEAAWQQGQEREVERRLLHTVRQELTEARVVIVDAVEYHRRIGEGALQVAEFNLSLRSETPTDSLIGLIYLDFVFAEVETALLDGATASGQLSLISNEHLRRLLAAWPRRVADLVEQEELIIDKVIANEPFLSETLDFAEPNVLGLRSRGFRGVIVPASPTTLRFLRSNVGRNIATMRGVNEAVAVRDGERLLAAIDELIAILNAELS